MPGMDGWMVLSALMADRELADIPVIMLTIVDDKQDGIRSGRVGVSHQADRPGAAHCSARQISARSAGPGGTTTMRAPRLLLRRILEAEGYAVVEAENGRAALVRMSERTPGAILLDLMMPEMDGFEFLSALHEREAWRQIPVVIITAKDLTAEDRERLNGSVVRILQKGAYGQEDLLAEVRALLAASIGRRKGKPDDQDPADRRQRDEPRHAVAPAAEARLREWSSPSTARKAWRRRRAEAPALILMDMSLPGVDGWEATRRLKAAAADARTFPSSR